MLERALPNTNRLRRIGLTMDNEGKYWFPAKRYGWGWGPPTTWQGWIVLLGYIAAVISIWVLLSPERHPLLFPLGIVLVTSALIAICLRKGEPPAWRWGGK